MEPIIYIVLVLMLSLTVGSIYKKIFNNSMLIHQREILRNLHLYLRRNEPIRENIPISIIEISYKDYVLN